MNKVVLDASALLALLNQESGFGYVEKHLSRAMMSTVNIAETVSVLIDTGLSQSESEKMVRELVAEIVPFDQSQAFVAAALKKSTKALGLSLGDRACLALAKLKNLTVFSADKVWAKLDLGMKIQIM